MPVNFLRTTLSRQRAAFFVLLLFFIGTLLFLGITLGRSFQSFTAKKMGLRELQTDLNDLTKLEAGLANSESKFRAFLLSGDSTWWTQLEQERIHFTQTAAKLGKITAIRPLMDSITKTAALKFALENELAAHLHKRHYSLQQHRQEVAKQFAPNIKRIKLGSHIRLLLDKAQVQQKATLIATREVQDRIQPVIIWQFAAIIMLIVLLMLFLLNKAYQGMAQRARSTAMMQTLLSSAHDGFYLLDNSWRFLLMNQKAKTYLHASLGVEPQQGDNLLELLPEDKREKFAQLVEQTWAGEQIIKKHSLLLDGRQSVIELQYRPVYDQHLNKNIGISVLLRDITVQTLAEDARRKSEATRRMIMNAVQDAVVCINKEGKITYWNSKAEVIFGWTKKEAIGLTLNETIIPKQHQAGHQGGLDRYNHTGKSRVMNKLLEMSAINKSGREFPAEMYILALNDGTEELICAFIRDISERKRSENERNALLERLRLTNGMVQLGSWQLDVANNRLTCDEVVYTVLELDTSFTLDRENWLAFVHSDDRDQVATQLNAFIERGTELELNFRIITPAGKTKYLYQRAVKHLNAVGKIQEIIGCVIDITEVKKAEATFRQVVNASPNALLLVNAQGKIVLANHQAEKLFGYTENELGTTAIGQLLPGQVPASNSLAPACKQASGDLWAIRKNSDKIPVEIGFSNMELEGEQLVLASVVDISERRAAEAERQELLTRFELAAGATQMGISEFDLTTGIMQWNDYMYNLMELPNTTPITFDYWRTLVHPDDLQMALQVFEQAIEQAQANFDMEYRVLLADKKIKVLQHKIITFCNEDGVVVRLLCTSLDITNQRQVEAAREELLTRFELAAETLHLGILDADLKSGSVQGDVQLKLMLGIEGIPNPDWRVWMRQVHPEDRSNMESLLQQGLPQGKLLQAEWRQQLPDGALRYFETKARIIWNSGIPARLIAATIDITHRVNQRNELIAAKLKAEKSEQLQEQFLANMSHEIRTPLNGIVGMSDLMSGTPLTSRQHEYLQVIQNSSQGLLTIINDVLDISKIKSGKFTIENAAFNLHHVINAAFELLLHRATQKDLSYGLQLDPDVPMMVKGDAGRLSQILINLLGNAVKFTRKGSVVLSVRPAGPYGEKMRLLFSVTDTGIGISDEVKQDIFNSFAQASRDISVEFGGTGLGLAISRQLVEMQGGTIEVESTMGTGSCFRVMLDYEVMWELPQTASVLSESWSAAAHTGKRVLVAEDNEVNRMVINEYLQKIGLSVTLAHDGRQAIETLLSQPPFDLIILDLRMPLMNGFETAGMIRRELCLQTPIMALSASTLRSENDNCLAVGMNAYMAKPFKASELYDNIYRLLNGAGPQQAGVAPPTGKEPEAALYDLSELEYLGDVDFALQIIDTFITNGQATLQELDAAFAGGRMAAVFELAHRMKSSAGMLGAAQLLTLLQGIETEARNDGKDKARLETLICQGQQQFAKVSEALKKAKEKVLVWKSPA